MMRTLHNNNINCPLPVLNIHGSEKTMEKLGNGQLFLIYFYSQTDAV